VIFGALAGELACSAVLAHVLVGAVARARCGLVEGPLHNKLALLLALVRRNYIRKNLITIRDVRILAGDTLTPSHVPSVAGRRPVSLSGHLTRRDSRLASLGVA